jgi:C-lobe and N-lobe beta barrels of Tf-binding protein B
MKPGWLVSGLAALALCACNGGSRGGFGAAGISVPFQAAGSTVVYAGPASGGPSSATASFTSGTGITALGTPLSDNAANTVALKTNAAGEIDTITLAIATGNNGPALPATAFAAVTQGTTTLTAAQFASLLSAIAATPSGTANAVYQGTVAGLSASAYGAWMRSTGGGNYDVGMYAFGPETAAMPVAGTATYNGTTLGFGTSDTKAPFAFAGTAQIMANFGTGTITSLKFTSIVTKDVNDANPGPIVADFSGSGAIVGNQYNLVISNGTLAGVASGLFHGTAAAETAGAWSATNGVNFKMIGSYGARK